MNGRRSDLEIVAEILKLAENGARQTRIMYGCNLNHGRVRGYLSTLETRGLVESILRGLHIEYVTTKRGRELLQTLELAMSTFDDGNGSACR